MTAFRILFLLVEVVIVTVFTTLFYVEMSFFVVMNSLFTIFAVKFNRGSSVIRIA